MILLVGSVWGELERVVLNGHGPDNVAVAQKLWEGLLVFEMACDVRDSTAVKAAAEQIEGSIGPIDILINNAGMLMEA